LKDPNQQHTPQQYRGGAVLFQTTLKPRQKNNGPKATNKNIDPYLKTARNLLESQTHRDGSHFRRTRRRRRRREKRAETVTAAGKEKGSYQPGETVVRRERLNTTGFGIYILKISFGLEREGGWRRV
jgi:hypothetical protein